MADYITKKSEYITKKEPKKEWITKKDSKKEWITKKKKQYENPYFGKKRPDPADDSPTWDVTKHYVGQGKELKGGGRAVMNKGGKVK